MHPLLHRWFVQYNPIYLVSATLVLAGMTLTARGLAHEGSIHGFLAVAAIAEVYALALIGGAALLTRIGQRRPAVMLGLLTVLYQSDLTLHTEACANLGPSGAIAGLGWLLLFGAKLLLLGWALRIRIERRALATALLGATGLVVMPHVMALGHHTAASAVLTLFVFALGSLAPEGGSVTSLAPLDDWGQTVLRRTVRATWIIWSVLFGLHVLFWSLHHPRIELAAIAALPFVLVRMIKSEKRTWLVLGALLAIVAVLSPSKLSPCAFLAALALLRRAFSRGNYVATTIAASATTSPYRAPEETTSVATIASSFVPIGPAERARLFGGALVGLHLAVWFFDWKGGAPPAHVLPLDIAFAAGALLSMWRFRARLVLAPLSVLALHGVIESGLVPFPQTMVGQGAAAVVLGFVLLGASLATSYRLRHTTQATAPATRTAPP